MKISEFRKIIREETKKALNESGGASVPESQWVKELTGKTIKKVLVKSNGPDLIVQMTNGDMYTIKKVFSLIKGNSGSSQGSGLFPPLEFGF